jgi:hypothetical protein
VPLFGILKEQGGPLSLHTLSNILDLTYLPVRPPFGLQLPPPPPCILHFPRENKLIPVKFVYDYCEFSKFQRDPKCTIELYLHAL